MSDNKPFTEYRAVFLKTGAAMYFSHLDLSRTVSRALRRSKQDIWMTEGFTPRPHLVFSPPLSLGYESTCELMDFRLNLGATLDKEAFCNAFPDAVKIVEVYTPERKMKEIAYADYTVSFRSECCANDIKALFSEPVEMIKKTKRSEQKVDITKFIKRLDCCENNGIISVNTTLSLSASESLSPSYLITAIKNRDESTSNVSVCRTAFRDSDMNIFK